MNTFIKSVHQIVEKQLNIYSAELNGANSPTTLNPSSPFSWRPDKQQ